MNSRERVLAALNFKNTDRIPKDLGGMLSTGISAFAYPKLVESLGLPSRLPKVYDTYQMLAMPDMDVLDALGCDTVTILSAATNAYDQPDIWHRYNFNGRLQALVQNPVNFKDNSDGSITQSDVFRMPVKSYVFDMEHGGCPVDFSGDLPKQSIEEIHAELEKYVFTDEQIQTFIKVCKNARSSTDKAIFFSGLYAGIAIGARGGLAVFPMLCLLEPDYVAEVHDLVIEYSLKNVRTLLPEISPYVDILMLNSDDWGTQSSLIASPDVFEKLFKPYYAKMNSECHRIAPDVKTFLHSCGAIYGLIDHFIESGFDILNPVQWSAGGHSYKEWKDKCRKRISLWGGGVNSQTTLPLGTVEDVVRECDEAVSYLSQDSGYVFCNIHNILAEIDPQKVIAMYKTAGRY